MSEQFFLTDLAHLKQNCPPPGSNTEGLSEAAKLTINAVLEQSLIEQRAERCLYLAPLICFRAGDMWRLAQGNCHHWDCPRCGQIRAREEYARIVEGARTLEEQGHAQYFVTLTCPGWETPNPTRGEIRKSLEAAETNYMKWTNRLLTNMRTKCARAGGHWAYVQVTERQKRQHPHSHLIMTWKPGDALAFDKGEILPNGRKAKHDTLWSEWFRQANVSAGLGAECDLSVVRSAAAVATYVSKYLFKDMMTTVWPKGWKRVRYSQSWPELPELNSGNAFPVINKKDWERIVALRQNVRSENMTVWRMAQSRGVPNVLPPKWDK